ncbi:MAG TPA: DUF2971 domain-containing protein [Thermoanaerobaculia bacterium]|jgi:hypothetical protein|nr:DUF2971 domain-containing protein [Thermoanaerobaculia bacterium]
MEPPPIRKHGADPKARELWAELNRQLPSATDATLYHYTSLAGFAGIVSSGVLWASDSQYLNDPSEGRYARAAMFQAADTFGSKLPSQAAAMLRQVVEQACNEASASSVFLTSFSEDGDLLSQWVAYTPDAAGVSLGMEGNILSEHPDVVLRKVIYEPTMQQNILHRVLRVYLDAAEEMRQYPDISAFDRIASVAHHILLVCAACFKDPAFFAEREWRAIRVYDLAAESLLPIRYRPMPYALVPYIDFRPSEHAMNIVREVIVGPGLEFELNRKSISNFCGRNSTPPRITPSQVPFRRVR